ncbi:MAG: acetyl-CoA C-acetyltransferase [Candidatus Berkiellales bacterium]
MQETKQNERVVYIVDGARTPYLKAKGVPGPFSAAELAIGAAKPLLQRQPFTPDKFNEVIVGCASPSEEEANIARVISLRIGCSNKVPAWTVQRNCASGLQAIECAARNIASGKSDLVLAGGTEAMSRIPLLLNPPMTTWLGRFNQAKTLSKKLKTTLQFRPSFLVPIIGILKGLTDPVVNLNMGQTAEELAYRFNVSRKEMDQYAALSHQRTLEAQATGLLSEIVPIYANDGTVFDQDEGVRSDATPEKLSKLKPAFEKFGDITAGNSSQITDGAAWVILASEAAVNKYQLPVLAKIIDTAWAALDPAIMGLGPVHAMAPILKRYQLGFEDIAHIEINEAFAAQIIACQLAAEDPAFCQEALGLSSALGQIKIEQLNPHGGAIAMGHPVGSTGARLVLHCAQMMKNNNNRYAMATLCIGGGQGGAMLLEKV